MIELQATGSRFRLLLQAHPMGRDWCVLLTGGEAHLGAVALGLPEASEATALGVPGHREDELSRRLAARLADGLGCRVAVACGIHLDHATKVEIQEIVALAEGLGAALRERVRTD